MPLIHSMNNPDESVAAVHVTGDGNRITVSCTNEVLLELIRQYHEDITRLIDILKKRGA